MRILRATLVNNPKKSYYSYECVFCGRLISYEHYNVALIGYDNEFIHGRAHKECVGGETETQKKIVRRKEKALFRVEKFNNSYQVGTPVNVKKDDGSYLETKTRTDAWALGSGIAVVSLEGIPGGFLLDRVFPKDQP